MALETRDALQILWNQHKDEQDWQRHSETQRSTFAQLLFVLSGALFAIYEREAQATGNIVPNLIILIGVFGVLMVLKYRERYLSHVAYAKEYRIALDNLLAPTIGGNPEDAPLSDAYKRADEAHSRSPMAKLLFYRQYTLWVIAFAVIAVAGFFLRQ